MIEGQRGEGQAMEEIVLDLALHEGIRRLSIANTNCINKGCA